MVRNGLPNRRSLCLVLLLALPLLVVGCGILKPNTYSVSGRVTDERFGNGIEGVRLFLSTGEVVISGGDGKWQKSGLHDSVTITPFKWNNNVTSAKWSFSPEKAEVTSEKSGVDFHAIPPEFSVCGRILDIFRRVVPGVKITFRDGSYPAIYTDSTGNWCLNDLRYPGEVTPSKDGWSFEPESVRVEGPQAQVEFTGTPSPYSISGRVMDEQGVPLSAVSIYFDNAGEVLTDENGRWSKSGLRGRVRVHATKNRWYFEPPSTNVEGDNERVNFTAFRFTYYAAGQVIDTQNHPIPGVTISFSNGFGETTSDAAGFWMKKGLFETVTVTPTKEGWTFAPETAEITDITPELIFTGSEQ